MNKIQKAPLSLALSALTLSAASFAADNTSPFQAQQLNMAYQLNDNNSAATGVSVKLKTQADNKTTEMKCGEGKCGEGKCGEGKCGADMKKQAAPKATEMKCGEGKCGEGKCGADTQKHAEKPAVDATGAKATTTEKAAEAKKKATDKAKEMKCGEGKCGSM